MAVAEDHSLSDANQIARFMGLSRWSRIEDLDLVGHVERGLPTRTLEIILKRVDPKGRWLKPTDVIPKATYYRLKDQSLSREQSERVLWLAKVLSEALRAYHNDAELTLHDQWKHLAKFVGRQIGEKAEPAEIHSENRPLMTTELMTRSQDRAVATQDQYEVRLDRVERFRFRFHMRDNLHAGLRVQELDEFSARTLHTLDVAASQHDQF